MVNLLFCKISFNSNSLGKFNRVGSPDSIESVALLIADTIFPSGLKNVSIRGNTALISSISIQADKVLRRLQRLIAPADQLISWYGETISVVQRHRAIKNQFILNVVR